MAKLESKNASVDAEEKLLKGTRFNLKGLKEEIKKNEGPDKPNKDLREKIADLSRKDTLSDDELKNLIDYTNNYMENTFGKGAINNEIQLSVNSVTDKQLEMLSKFSAVFFEKLEKITDKQAETLSKMRFINLGGLKKLTDKQAELLSKMDTLYINIENITDTQIETLSKTKRLGLYGQKSITDTQAEILSKVDYLNLSRLEKITDEQAEKIAKVNHLMINRDILTPKQKEILGGVRGW